MSKNPTTSKKPQHVVSTPSGGWGVRSSGSTRASKHFTTQAAAAKYARSISQKQGTTVVIHRRDGTVQSSNTYGNDPHPPAGNK